VPLLESAIKETMARGARKNPGGADDRGLQREVMSQVLPALHMAFTAQGPTCHP
jgi:hypothetical protein